MKAIAIILTSVLVLSVAVLSFDSAGSVSACPSTNSLRLVSDSLYPDGADGFVYITRATWKTVSKPFIGTIEQATGSLGVQDVTYTPSYWFPRSCENGLPILVQGKKAGAGVHVVNSFMRVGPGAPSANTAEAMLIP